VGEGLPPSSKQQQQQDEQDIAVYTSWNTGEALFYYGQRLTYYFNLIPQINWLCYPLWRVLPYVDSASLLVRLAPVEVKLDILFIHIPGGTSTVEVLVAGITSSSSIILVLY